MTRYIQTTIEYRIQTEEYSQLGTQCYLSDTTTEWRSTKRNVETR